MIDAIMRSSRSSLAVILPEFSAALRRLQTRLPAFERLAAQSGGMKTTPDVVALENWQSELLVALELSDTHRYPSGPLTYLGLGGHIEEGTWMHADPIRLEMSNDGMRAQITRPWSREERVSVEKIITDHLKREKLEWHSMEDRAFIRSLAELEFTAIAPARLQRSSLRDMLPQGRDSAFVRRLTTELQMLLHDKLSDSAPNSIWLWGAGATSRYEPRQLPALFCDAPYALGLYHVHAASDRVKRLPRTFDELLQHQTERRSVVILSTQEIDVLERDWFAPMLRALNRGLVDSIELFIDGYRLVANRSFFRRFFARSRSIELPVAESQ